MHETSIVQSLIHLIDEQLADQGPVQVRSVRLRIGPLAGVVPEALQFAFDATAPGTIIENARLAIENIPITAWCPTCDALREIPSPQRLICSTCSEPLSDLRTGRELELAAIEVVELNSNSPQRHGDTEEVLDQIATDQR